MERKISGIYIRHQKEDGSWGNICFEDMDLEEREKFLKTKDKEWIASLALELSNVINELAERFEIVRED